MRILLTILIAVISNSLFAQKSKNTQQQLRKPSSIILPFLQNGVECEKKKDFRCALENYTKAIETNPQDPFGYYQRGLLCAGTLSNYVSAIEDLTKVIQLWNNFSMAYCLRGSCYINMQNLPAAIADLNKSVGFDSTNVLAYFNLATAYRLSSRFDEALVIITKAIRLRPDVVDLYLERMETAYRLRRFADALADCNIVLAKDRNNVRANKFIPSIRYEMRDFQGAIEQYSSLIERFGYQKEFYFGRADVHRALGRFANAQVDLQTVVVSSEPASLEHFAAKAKIIENYLSMQEFSRVVDSATSFLRSNPQDFGVFANVLGSINFGVRQDKFFNGIVYTLRALARKNLLDTAGARRDCEKALILGFSNAQILRDSLVSAFQAFTPHPSFPSHLQFYARTLPNNTATVPIQGTFRQTGFDSAYCEIWSGEVLQQRLSAPLKYIGAEASVDFQPSIEAKMQEYRLRLGVKSSNRDTILAERSRIVCGDVIALSGQSNIVYGAIDSIPQHRFVRTFFLGSKDEYWWQPSGNKSQEASIGAVGLTIADELMRSQGVPVCVLNFGIEGSIIETHFPDNTNPTNPKTWFGRMLWRLRESKIAGAIKAFVWYQGESNSEGGDSETYREKFFTLHKALQAEMPSLRKTYIVQIRPSHCVNTSGHALLREEQRQLGLQAGFEAVSTVALPGYDGCHYTDAGYIALGRQLARMVKHDIYALSRKGADTSEIHSPVLEKAYWANSNTKNEIVLQFRSSSDIIATSDTTLFDKKRTLLEEGFLIDGKHIGLTDMRFENNIVRLRLPASMSAAQRISYIPDKCYADSPQNNCFLYGGPWLVTKNGLGVLTFHNVPIEAAP